MRMNISQNNGNGGIVRFVVMHFILIVLFVLLIFMNIGVYVHIQDYTEAVEAHNSVMVTVDTIDYHTYKDSDGDRHEKYRLYGSYYYNDEDYSNIYIEEFTKRPENLSEGDVIECYVNLNDPTTVYFSEVKKSEQVFAIAISLFILCIYFVILVALNNKMYSALIGLIVFVIYNKRQKRN